MPNIPDVENGSLIKSDTPSKQVNLEKIKNKTLILRSKINELIMNRGMELADVTIRLALGGNTAMLKLLWDRILPPIREIKLEDSRVYLQ